MGYFGWEGPVEDTCEEIPDDACDVNYCPIALCEWDEVNQGLSAVVTIRLGPDGTATEVDCVGSLLKRFTVQYPAIKIVGNGTTEWYDGSILHPISIPLDITDKIIYPLVYDDNGNVRYFKPARVPGIFKLVSKNRSIRAIPDVFPALMENDLETDNDPEFYLGANAARLLCSTSLGQTIQLLKIVIPE